MTVSTAPSRIARKVAAREWGSPVQDQQKIAPGTFEFSTPGHGGVVAVVSHLPIPEPVLAVARRHRLVEQHFGVEVWIGEEDCAWATLHAAVPAVVEGKVRTVRKHGGYTNPEEWIETYGTTEYARGVCERWYPEFLRDLDLVLAGEVDQQAFSRTHGGWARA